MGFHPGGGSAPGPPEFIAKAVQTWLAKQGVKTHYIDPGSPWQNAYNESFNSIFRTTCLDRWAFESVSEAKVITDRETGRSRGFGFVTFEEDSAADEAITAMNGTQLDGREINVNVAQDRPRDNNRRGGGGGGRGGRGGFGGGGGGRDRW